LKKTPVKTVGAEVVFRKISVGKIRLFPNKPKFKAKFGNCPAIMMALNLIFASLYPLFMNKILLFVFIVLIAACNNNNPDTTTTIPAADNSNASADLHFSVVNIFPHDTTSYTEGFLVHEGKLYESSGYTETIPSTRSLFGEVDMKTGRIQPKAELDKKKYFGEGISFFDGKIYQLTWTTHIGFIYDAKTFKKLGEFSYNTDGWGMTTDGTYLIMSDGSSNLSYHDPTNFKLIKILGVSDNNGPVANINELEYIDGFIYANIYQTNYIIKIDPASGKVVGRADFSSIAAEAKNKYPGSEYMNGIAYDSAAKKIYITGKLWPNIYEVKFN
jgi:glutamine cyclotransferase